MDTIQGVLKYQRPGADGKVRWAPPTALRRIDLILLDEGSQYEDIRVLSSDRRHVVLLGSDELHEGAIAPVLGVGLLAHDSRKG